MGYVIMELKIMVDNGMICMVKLEKMFECSCSLFVLCLNVMDVYRLDIYS